MKRSAPSRRMTRRVKARRMTRRVPRGVRLPMVTVNRTWWANNWTPGTTSVSDYWRYFTVQLSQMPNSTEYTSLFDTYRVNSITLTLRPRYDGFTGNDTTDTTLPGVTNQGATRVHVILDPKSPVTPAGLYTSATLNTYLENGKVKTYSGNRAINIPVKYPCFADDVNGSAASIYRSCRSQWISTSATAIQFRGAHVFLQDINLTGTFGQSFDTFLTMNVSFRGMR